MPPDDVEKRRLDHRLGIGKSPHALVETGHQALHVMGVFADQMPGDAIVDQMADDLRVFTEIAPVLAAPAEDRRRFAETGNAGVRRHLEDDVTPDRHLQGPPRVVGASGQGDNDGLEAGDLHDLAGPLP